MGDQFVHRKNCIKGKYSEHTYADVAEMLQATEAAMKMTAHHIRHALSGAST